MKYSWMNPSIEVRKAGPLGIGTFAKSAIKKNELVIVQGGIIISDADFDNPDYAPYAYHCFQVEQDAYICPVNLDKETFDGIFNVNHSCDPTCGISGQISMVALRDIEPDEEITFDYAMSDVGSEELGWEDMDCLCGSANCRSKITGKDWRIPELQQKYKGYFSRYVQDLIDAGTE